MSFILVDTTVWIDFFNKRENSKQADVLNRLIEEGEYNICICPIIYQEILQGIKEEKTFEEIKNILQSIIMINTPILKVADYAVDLYRGLRKKGITIRKPYDCLIASYAILEDIYLLHNDSDFRQMENNSKLKVYS
ncbi:MAG: PIN domain-containing protein [Treponema sp.]|jgi:predicted nucleic acid-binding protein|nr:PIN domain-containing protein [Treponema sp.]